MYEDAAGSITVVPTRGLTWWDGYFALLAYVVALPVGTLMYYFLAVGGFPDGFLGSFIAALVSVSVGYIVILSLASVRRVTVNTSGVSFRFLFNTEHVGWTSLSPGKDPVAHGAWWIRSSDVRSSPSRLPRAYRLTRQQARAILSHPCCPKWNLQLETLRDLGLSANSE